MDNIGWMAALKELDEVLSNLVQWKVFLPVAGGLEQDDL